MGIAAPVIVAEMDEWVALGGGNSGIVADPSTHDFGFHMAANEIGPDDYSRWRDPQGSDGPYVDWSYACAGDFRHGGDETLRAMHADVLARLMRGELPMICEFIGKPWADQPVYYWARWNGVQTLQRYTGSGHDTWSHISWYRSMVDRPAHLWKVEDDMNEEQAAQALVTFGRMEAITSDRETVIIGPTAGEPNKLRARLDALDARLAKLETGGIDPAALKAAVIEALKDPAGQEALTAAANKAEDI